MDDMDMDGDWLDENVEAYVDGHLSTKDRRRFEAAMAVSHVLRTSVDAAERIRAVLSDMETPACPDSAVSEVLTLAANSRERDLVAGRRYFDVLLQPPGYHGWALLAAGVATAVVAALFFSRALREPSEVDQGLADVKLALAYVGMAGQQTGDIVRLELVDEGIMFPMQRAVRHATGGLVSTAARRPSPAASPQYHKPDTTDE